VAITISIPAASAARSAAQFRGLILGPVEGIRVPSISIAISWMLTPLFYLLHTPAAGNAPNCKPSNIINLCLPWPTSSAPTAIPKSPPKPGKPFALNAVEFTL
jgi:hypothetical protein